MGTRVIKCLRHLLTLPPINSRYHWWDTQVFCVDDDKGFCSWEPGYIAVDNKFDKYGVALGFCKRYFSLGKLKDVYNSAKGDARRKWDLSEYENRARPWITTSKKWSVSHSVHAR
jgi:hypothetical protein